MSNQLFYVNLLLAFYLSCHYAVSQTENSTLPLKAVNLGNWLVIEGWMKPSLFDAITNKDLLDGTQVQFMSTKLQKYLSAEHGGGSIVVANCTKALGWETFRSISETLVLGNYEVTSWNDSDPSVFKMTVLTGTTIRGEYQITNGYGLDKATKIMRVNICFKENKEPQFISGHAGSLEHVYH